MATRAGARRRRWIWITLVAVGLAALLVLVFRPGAVAVDVAAVERGPLRVTLDEEGRTRVRDRYVISAPVTGELLRIELEPGDPVVAGETVVATFRPALPALLDARTRAEALARRDAAESTLGLARADLARARAERQHARTELERIARLAADGVASTEQLDATRLAADTAEETLRAAEFAVRTATFERDQAQAALLQISEERGESDPLEIRSPVGGVVLGRHRESASVVSAGEPLVEVADPTRLEIVCDSLSEDAVRIPAGAAALIDRWGGTETLRGRVRRVEPAGFTEISALGVEEQRVNVILDLDAPRSDWAALGDGFRVEARVVIWEAADVLKLPTSSLFRAGSDWAVFVVDHGRARLTPVAIGWRNGTEAEVRGGLRGGERVVLYPSDDVRDGVRLEERAI